MVDVRLPSTNASLVATLGETLMYGFGTFVPCYDIGGVGGPPGVFYARVSAQVYSELADFEKLAAAVLAVLG
jgi:hypothetical protein